jgi:predicted dehydrogenase
MSLAVLDLRVADDALRRSVADAPWEADAGVTLVGPDDPRAAQAAAVLLLCDHALDPAEIEDLRARAAGRPLVLLGPTLAANRATDLARSAGVEPGGSTPRHEIRLRPDGALAGRGAREIAVADRLLVPDAVADDVEVHATANIAFTDHAAATWRPATGVAVMTLGGDADPWRSRDFLRLLHRWLHLLTGTPERAVVRVGLIGYGAIGHEHARAIGHVPGLELTAVADRSPARLDAAATMTPGVRTADGGDEVLGDADVDLVVVSTPPSTHADWALRALDAGKHVVLEKPMALTAQDCDTVMARAREVDRLAVVYQNRRFDPDYRVLHRVVASGGIGEVFHLEAFVGGYGHPCNYWHSDADVSGGALFDWGSHAVDQVLDLVDLPIEHVTGANHKRVWHDVTNADHARLTIRFDGGAEAEFVYSDLAAAVKPKWYVLGTRGAVVGEWRREKVVARSPIGTLDEDVLALADSPATLVQHHPDGSSTALAVEAPEPNPFHHDLDDHLREGMPMRVTAVQARGRGPRGRGEVGPSGRPPGGPVMSVRWGFIGAGWIARVALAPAVHAADGARLQAVAARDPLRAAGLGPVGGVYDDYRALLDDPSVEAVYISLSNEAHKPWTLAALAAGKHVLCEKPLALDADEVAEMAAAAEAAGRLLVEATWYRWHPRTRRAAALLRAGVVGPVREVESGFVFDGVAAGNYRLDPARGGGALYDLGPYSVGAALWAVPDEEPTVVRAEQTTSTTGVDLTMDATLVLGSATARTRSSVAETDAQWLRIAAEGGGLEFSAPVFTDRWAPSRLTVRDGDTERVEEFPAVDPYQVMVEHVSRAIRGDGTAWLLPLTESLRVARTTDAIFAAARAG